MNQLELIKIPNVLLYTKSIPIQDITPEILEIARAMLNIMYSNNGAGLAAIQVGVAKRLIVIDCSRERNQPLILINPVITKASTGCKTIQEGCLSVPDQLVNIKRPGWIRVNYTDLNGQAVVLKTDGLLAACIQHEIDHLDGITILDKTV